MLAWERALGLGWRRVRGAAEVQARAKKLRAPYLAWLSQLAKAENSPEWWSSSIAESNTLVEDSLFQKIVWLRLAIDTPDAALIVAEDPSLLVAICKHIPNTRWASPGARFGILAHRIARLLYRWSRYYVEAVAAHKAARFSRPAKLTAPPEVLVHTCIDESYITDGAAPKDRYFGGLVKALMDKGLDVGVLVWPYSLNRPLADAYRWLRRSSVTHVILEDQVGWRDHFEAMRLQLRLLRKPFYAPQIDGLDVGALVAQARWDQAANTENARFLLYGRIIERWAAEGWKPKLWIDLFENTAAEKPQVLALRRLLPQTRTIGYQHYSAPPPFMLRAFACPRPEDRAPLPDRIVCSSKFNRDLLAREGFSLDRLVVGPSFRMPAEAAREPGPALLLCLPLEESAAVELLQKASAALRGKTVGVRTHAMTGAAGWHRLLEAAGWTDLPDGWTRTDAPLTDAMRRCACAVVSASTISLDLALAGVPVAVVGREMDVDMDPLAWFENMPAPVYDAPSLLARVNELSQPAAQDAWRRWAAAHRAECVSPINEQTLAPFFDAPKPRASLGDVGAAAWAA